MPTAAPTKKLRVSIGSSRFSQQIASVNDIAHPTLIDTPLFAGRIVVYVKDFVGETPDGSPPIKECSYFDGRSRKFAILIEGRFKRREGVKPYTGDEVHFGSDFDRLPETFPHGPFNAGMRIAKYIDPATFFDEASPRPYIMSPYAACMNTICAYPAPTALNRALLLAHHDAEHPHVEGEAYEGSLVPTEGMEGKKRVLRNPWRFVGLRGNALVEAFVEQNKHLLAPTLASSHPIAPVPSLGTSPRKSRQPTRHASLQSADDSETPSESEAIGRLWGAIPGEGSQPGTPVVPPSKKKSASRFSLAGLRSALEGVESQVLGEGDLVSGEVFKVEEGTGPLDDQLGPWRFGEEGVDAMEDSTFVFLDPSHAHSVPQRRKHFVVDGGKHRKALVYDPDIVYTTSFFTNFCDLNTFELKMGPVHLNIAPYFADMPIRYTLRSTRLAPRVDGSQGPLEEECFATIAFELVDV